MKNNYLSLSGLLIACLLLFVFSNVNAQKEKYGKRYEFKVKIRPQSQAKFENLPPVLKSTRQNQYIKTGIESVDNLNMKFYAKKLVRLFPNAGKYEDKHRRAGLHLWYVITLDSTRDVSLINCINEFKLDGNIEIAEPFYKMNMIDPVETSTSFEVHTLQGTFPNDPMFSEQWGYYNTGQNGGVIAADINLKNAWQLEKGDTCVIVAVIDGGVDFSHPDLAGTAWINTAEKYGTAGVDDDNNGYIDDINGFNFYNQSGNIWAVDHGTHVAGTIDPS